VSFSAHVYECRDVVNNKLTLSPKKCIRKINAKVELSTWTFEDAMAFADGEFAMAA